MNKQQVIDILEQRRKDAFDSPLQKFENRQMLSAIEAVESLVPPEYFNQWISVEDRFPEKEGVYLVFDSNDPDIEILYFDGYFISMEPSWGHGHITHWMPLPELPE